MSFASQFFTVRWWPFLGRGSYTFYEFLVSKRDGNSWIIENLSQRCQHCCAIWVRVVQTYFFYECFDGSGARRVGHAEVEVVVIFIVVDAARTEVQCGIPCCGEELEFLVANWMVVMNGVVFPASSFSMWRPNAGMLIFSHVLFDHECLFEDHFA